MEQYKENLFYLTDRNEILLHLVDVKKLYGVLLTSDAHTLYSQYGFKEIKDKCMCKF